jgi:hypothetical protein
MLRHLAVFSGFFAFLCLGPHLLFADAETYKKQMGGSGNVMPADYPTLPAACVAKLGLETPDGKRGDPATWMSVLGEAWGPLGHYCMGIVYLKRTERGVGDRIALLNTALENFRYEEHFTSDQSILRAEVEFNIGYVLYLLNRTPEAIVPLQKAILLKSDYLQAYIILSSCYSKSGEKARAAKILETGLVKMPGSQLLQNALNDLNKTK